MKFNPARCPECQELPTYILVEQEALAPLVFDDREEADWDTDTEVEKVSQRIAWKEGKVTLYCPQGCEFQATLDETPVKRRKKKTADWQEFAKWFPELSKLADHFKLAKVEIQVERAKATGESIPGIFVFEKK